MTINPQVVQSDCFDFLSTIDNETVDLILTDPPYNISRDCRLSVPINHDVKARLRKAKKPYYRVNMDFGEWDKEEIDLPKLAKEFYRVLKDGGTAIVWYDLWKITLLNQALIDAKFCQTRLIVWQKSNPVPINSQITYLSNSREIAVSAVRKGKSTFHSEYDNGMYFYPLLSRKLRKHPTQKPLKLFQELITKHSNENDVVLDVFAGAGTTAVACRNTQRQFLGCESNKEYVDIGNQRLLSVQKNFVF